MNLRGDNTVGIPESLLTSSDNNTVGIPECLLTSSPLLFFTKHYQMSMPGNHMGHLRKGSGTWNASKEN